MIGVSYLKIKKPPVYAVISLPEVQFIRNEKIGPYG